MLKSISVQVFLRNPTDENVIPIVEELCRRLPMKRDVSAEANGVEPAKLRASSKSRLLVDMEDGKFSFLRGPIRFCLRHALRMKRLS